MTIGRRIDDTTAVCPEWMPIVEQAMINRSVRGLPKPPPGIEYHKGEYYTRTFTERNDGTVRVTLKWVWPGRCLVVGAWTEGAGHANTYPVGKQITLTCGRVVQVALVGGLPYPMPVLP